MSDLKFSTAFVKALEVLFVVHLFQSHMFGLSLGFSNKSLGVSLSLRFYHLPPLSRSGKDTVKEVALDAPK